MYQLIEGCLVVFLGACLLWALAFGVTVNGTHYELVCARGCKVVERSVESHRFNLARREHSATSIAR